MIADPADSSRCDHYRAGLSIPLALALAVMTLPSCARQDDPSVIAGEPIVFDLPACAQVWKDGATLPRDYEGCEGPTTTELGAGIDCWNSPGLMTYDDRFFALLGGEITEAPVGSEAYDQAYDECVGN